MIALEMIQANASHGAGNSSPAPSCWRGFGLGKSKILEIIVAPEDGSDIFRAPFDRNRCDGLLAESI
jgi:hypothetical protein